MSLQNATYSSDLVGTSSSGVLPIAYARSWENQTHEDAHIFLSSPKSFESAEITAWPDLSVHSPLLTMSFSAVATTKSLDDIRIFEQLARGLGQISMLYEPTIGLRVYLQQTTDAIPSFYVGVTTFEPENLTIANPELGDFWKIIHQSMQKRQISDRLDVLAQREDNWDGYDSQKPTELTLNRARDLMEELFDSIISAGHVWLTPFISSDEDGHITAEWYEKGRQLHIQIGENEMEYLQVWGINIDTEMHEGFLNHDNYLTLWEWLLDG